MVKNNKWLIKNMQMVKKNIQMVKNIMVENKLVCTVSPSKIRLKIKQNYFCFAFEKGWVLSKVPLHENLMSLFIFI